MANEEQQRVFKTSEESLREPKVYSAETWRKKNGYREVDGLQAEEILERFISFFNRNIKLEEARERYSGVRVAVTEEVPEIPDTGVLLKGDKTFLQFSLSDGTIIITKTEPRETTYAGGTHLEGLDITQVLVPGQNGDMVDLKSIYSHKIKNTLFFADIGSGFSPRRAYRENGKIGKTFPAEVIISLRNGKGNLLGEDFKYLFLHENSHAQQYSLAGDVDTWRGNNTKRGLWAGERDTNALALQAARKISRISPGSLNLNDFAVWIEEQLRSGYEWMKPQPKFGYIPEFDKLATNKRRKMYRKGENYEEYWFPLE